MPQPLQWLPADRLLARVTWLAIAAPDRLLRAVHRLEFIACTAHAETGGGWADPIPDFKPAPATGWIIRRLATGLQGPTGLDLDFPANGRSCGDQRHPRSRTRPVGFPGAAWMRRRLGPPCVMRPGGIAGTPVDIGLCGRSSRPR